MSKEHSVLYFIFTISGLSLLSKVFGLFREGIIAAYFGITAETDLYFFIYSIFTALIAISITPMAISYLPIFVSKRDKLGEQMAANHFTKLLQQFFVISFFIALIINVILCFVDTLSLGKAWQTENKDAIFYIRLFSLIFFLGGSIQIFSSVLNGIKQYGKFQIATILQNIVVIIFVLLFGKHLGVRTLALAVTVAYLLQFIYMSVELYGKRGNKIVLSNDIIHDKELSFVYKSIIPVAFGAEAYLVCLTIDKAIGKSLGIEGVVSALNYAGLLYGLVNTVIIMAVVTVYYTEFTSVNIKKGEKYVLEMLNDAIVSISFILIPLVVFLSFNAEDFITVVLKRGKFTEQSVLFTAIPFAIYILNSPIYAIRSLIIRIFYVFGNVKIPMYNGIAYIFCSIVLGIVFSKIWGVLGITLAALLASVISCLFLFFVLKKRFLYEVKDVYAPLLKIIIAVIVSLLSGSVFSINLNNSWVNLGVSGIVFMGIYLIILYFLRLEKLVFLLDRVKSKLHNK